MLSLKSKTTSNSCNEQFNSNKDDYFETLNDKSLNKNHFISSTIFESNCNTQSLNNNVKSKADNLTDKNDLITRKTHLLEMKLKSKLNNLNNSFKEMVRGMDQMPVSVLQSIFNHFSYKEVFNFFNKKYY